MKIGNTKIILPGNNDGPIINIIKDALRHIAEEQLPCGNFLSYSSPLPADFSGAIPYSTTFFTSNIIACLCSVRSLVPANALSLQVSNDMEAVIRRGTGFLLQEKSERWSFNYFSREGQEYRTSPYPDDLDDTFAALTALQLSFPAAVSGEALAAAVKLLIDLEVSEGGPYRTWIVPPDPTTKMRNRADVVTNGTIGYFLSLLGIRSPRITEYLTDEVGGKIPSSLYYPGPCQVAYFLSRYFGSGPHCGIEDALFLSLSPNVGTPLEFAMRMSTYFHCGHPEMTTPNMVGRLIDMVSGRDWQPYPFCIDPAKDHVSYYAGSSALTAAFIAEALARYEYTPGCANIGTPTIRSFHQTIRDTAERECGPLPKTLGATAMARIECAFGAMITAPSHDLQKILNRKTLAIPEDTARSLALAGLYGWLAYDIYDDFLDGEGQPSLLPAANYFLRKLSRIYARLAEQFPATPLAALFDTTMDTLDGANEWEVAHCAIPASDTLRLPDPLPSYGDHDNLADRSMGYAAGPLAELLLAGYLQDSVEYRAVESLFRHYLIARQLHDDAHDWEEDLLRGRINGVAAILVGEYRVRFPECSRPAIANIIKPLRTFFWKETLDRTVTLIRAHIEKARCARDSCTLLNGTSFMEDALAKLEHGAAHALAERDRTLTFLNLL
ncbi:MAG: class 1 isoprenoid biosynthesis enzyme [Candidatus Pacebacteria bacterium]|nr:class 1 isoprenoid biosynthesis enzyme [Candidatus Paceibacterota bacterium]